MGSKDGEERGEGSMVRKGNLLRFGTSLSGERSGAGPHG